jgi:hypothetical membrane protein
VRLGAIVWTLSIQFFVAQIVVQSAWTTPFSLAHNYISDLGNTTCGPYPEGSRTYVCSPWHAWMNASFILQGLIIVLGMVLVWRAFPVGLARSAGSILLVVAGLGNVAVGLFPEDVNVVGHRMGAAAHFFLGNLGMILLGIALGGVRRWSPLAYYSVVSGVVGELTTWLFVSGHDGPLGVGGMERVAAYALPVWLMVTGATFASGFTGGGRIGAARRPGIDA